MTVMEKLYLCDGTRNCNCSDACYKNGGPCMITTLVEHSLFNVYIELSSEHNRKNCTSYYRMDPY